MSIEPLQVPKGPAPPTGNGALIDDLLDTPSAGQNGESTTRQPLSRRGQRRDARLRARKVKRVIRRIEPWSVLKVSSVLYLCLWLVLTVAGVILWQVARATGTLDNLEDFLATALADESFTIDGPRVLVASLTAGVVIVFAGTGLTVLLAVLFNLVSELTGGLRVAVVELETASPVEPEGTPNG
jgi:hypothetical protein